jgi:hypothetical protein
LDVKHGLVIKNIQNRIGKGWQKALSEQLGRHPATTAVAQQNGFGCTKG